MGCILGHTLHAPSQHCHFYTPHQRPSLETLWVAPPKLHSQVRDNEQELSKPCQACLQPSTIFSSF